MIVEEGGDSMNEKETGQFIAEIRKQKNMTQRELAEQIGVSDKTISKWETGKSIPDLPYLKDLCAVIAKLIVVVLLIKRGVK